jgi:hypothetical protein
MLKTMNLKTKSLAKRRILVMYRKTLVLFLFLSAGCSVQQSTPIYTGIIKLDEGTEYAALDEPSHIGGKCEGWQAVEIRQPGMAGAGMTNLVCWKREGDIITISDRTGSQQKSGPASIWSD